VNFNQLTTTDEYFSNFFSDSDAYFIICSFECD